MEKITLRIDLVKLMGAFDSTVKRFLSTSNSAICDNELLREFCDCCQVSPASPLAFAFLAFSEGVEYGRFTAANGQEGGENYGEGI